MYVRVPSYHIFTSHFKCTYYMYIHAPCWGACRPTSRAPRKASCPSPLLLRRYWWWWWLQASPPSPQQRASSLSSLSSPLSSTLLAFASRFSVFHRRKGEWPGYIIILYQVPVCIYFSSHLVSSPSFLCCSSM